MFETYPNTNNYYRFSCSSKDNINSMVTNNNDNNSKSNMGKQKTKDTQKLRNSQQQQNKNHKNILQQQNKQHLQSTCNNKTKINDNTTKSRSNINVTNQKNNSNIAIDSNQSTSTNTNVDNIKNGNDPTVLTITEKTTTIETINKTMIESNSRSNDSCGNDCGGGVDNGYVASNSICGNSGVNINKVKNKNQKNNNNNNKVNHIKQHNNSNKSNNNNSGKHVEKQTCILKKSTKQKEQQQQVNNNNKHVKNIFRCNDKQQKQKPQQQKSLSCGEENRKLTTTTTTTTNYHAINNNHSENDESRDYGVNDVDVKCIYQNAKCDEQLKQQEPIQSNSLNDNDNSASVLFYESTMPTAGEILVAALTVACLKCSKPTLTTTATATATMTTNAMTMLTSIPSMATTSPKSVTTATTTALTPLPAAISTATSTTTATPVITTTTAINPLAKPYHYQSSSSSGRSVVHLNEFIFTTNNSNSINSKQYRKSKSYTESSRNAFNVINSTNINNNDNQQQSQQHPHSHQRNGDGSSSSSSSSNTHHHHQSQQQPQHYRRSYSRSSFDRNFADRNKGFVPIVPPLRPILSSSNIGAIIVTIDQLTIVEHIGKARITYPIMQCGALNTPDSTYHQNRSIRMDNYQIDDGFHSDGGTETPPLSPSSGSSITSTSDHGSLESVDTGGTQRLAVLSFEQVNKLHDVMDEVVAIHGRGNFPTLEVKLKDLVNAVRRKLEAEIVNGGAGVLVKDIRLNGGAASHVLAIEDQQYNDLDLIFAIELSTTRHFDRVKSAVLNTLLDLLPEGVSKRRIMPCALKEAYVGKMVKVNNNNDGDRWSLISLGSSPGHKNVELKFVDTMRRQFEFSVDSFQIVLDSLLLFYDCAQLPISENFYPTVVGESVYGDFQEALYHLQKKLISTRQPEEIRGGGLLKYCNLLVRNYKPVDPQHIKTLERYMCSRFFIDFPDIGTQTVKLEAYLRNHFWGADEEPLQYQYLMHLREVVEMSTVCLMGHERRQTIHLIQSLAAQILYKEQQKQQQQQIHGDVVSTTASTMYHHHHHLHQQQQHSHQHLHQQQQQQTQLLTIGELQQQQQTLQQSTQQQPQQQQQPQTVTLLTTTTPSAAEQSVTTSKTPAQTQTIYLQQVPTTSAATICCTVTTASATPEQKQQTQQQQIIAHSQQQQQQITQVLSNASAAAAGLATTGTTTTSAMPQTIQIQAGPPGLIYANGVYYAPVIPTTICTCNSTWLST